MSLEELEARVTDLERLMGLRAAAPQSRAVNLLESVAAAHGVTVSALAGASRTSALVVPRHIFCWLARLCGLSLPAVARLLNRNHTAVHYACLGIEDRLDTDPSFLKHVREIAALNRVELPQRYRV